MKGVILVSFCIYVAIIAAAFFIGRYLGQQKAYSQFQLEECWVNKNKENNDILCIQYLD